MANPSHSQMASHLAGLRASAAASIPGAILGEGVPGLVRVNPATGATADPNGLTDTGGLVYGLKPGAAGPAADKFDAALGLPAWGTPGTAYTKPIEVRAAWTCAKILGTTPAGIDTSVVWKPNGGFPGTDITYMRARTSDGRRVLIGYYMVTLLGPGTWHSADYKNAAVFLAASAALFVGVGAIVTAGATAGSAGTVAGAAQSTADAAQAPAPAPSPAPAPNIVQTATGAVNSITGALQTVGQAVGVVNQLQNPSPSPAPIPAPAPSPSAPAAQSDFTYPILAAVAVVGYTLLT